MYMYLMKAIRFQKINYKMEFWEFSQLKTYNVGSLWVKFANKTENLHCKLLHIICMEIKRKTAYLCVLCGEIQSRIVEEKLNQPHQSVLQVQISRQ